MKTKLITALRATANALEQGTFYYEWKWPQCCNCGSLFCALTGMSASELREAIPSCAKGIDVTWKNTTGQHCPITGITQKDIIDLEYLRNPEVVKRMGLKPTTKTTHMVWLWKKRKIKTVIPPKVNHTHRAHVIAYMRAWADLLTEEGAMDVPAQQTEPEVNHA